MKPIDNRKQKALLLDMLVQLDRYCKENGIQYFLDSGTLLGAVRHQGFIPWDDDIDICMTRPNYDRFIQALSQKKIAEHIDLCLPEDTLFPYIKICDNRTLLVEYPDTLRLETGIYIDIFPKDGHPESLAMSKLHCKIASFFTCCYWFNKYSIPVWKKGSSPLKKAIATLAAPLLYNRKLPLRIVQRIARRYPYSKANYTSSILAGGIRGRVPTKCFASALEADFEGHKFPIPVGYDQYLRKLYENINNGDYMILPPEHQKVIHDTEIYWK